MRDSASKIKGQSKRRRHLTPSVGLYIKYIVLASACTYTQAHTRTHTYYTEEKIISS